MIKKKILISVILVLLTIIPLRIFIGEPCYIPSPSMEPTLLVGDWLWLDKTTYGGKSPKRFGDIPLLNIFTWISFLRESDEKNDWGDNRWFGKRKPLVGDIVVFYNPNNSKELFVKRVDNIIYQGDSLLVCAENRAIIEDLMRKETDTIVTSDLILSDSIFQYYILKQNYYFMRGDNADNSLDSRSYGFIKDEDIIGKINTILFSIFKEDDVRWIYFRKGRFFLSVS